MGYFRGRNINKAGSSLLAALVGGVLLSGCAGQSTAYDADKIMVCHEGRTLVIPETALSAHLGHGDARGACAS